jgi:mannan endo-1,4-beta-mannosidase
MRAVSSAGAWVAGGAVAVVLIAWGLGSEAQTNDQPATKPGGAAVTAPAAGAQATPRRRGPMPWKNPQPDVPYLPKPATQPADWLVEHEPVTPNASPEARALLKLLYSISPKHTLTGQHNYAAAQWRSTTQAVRVTGKTPAIYGTDWGSSKDEIGENRSRVVQNIIEAHKRGHIIAICWHEVRPLDDEPATFRGSVQAKLTNAQFEELITPGTELNKRWCAQVDVMAEYMKQLRDAHVPILFRPYHEMNGDWFWWGGRRGERGTKQMYRMIFERLVNYHKLNNLVWVWNVDRPEREDRQFVDYFPGQQYVDVLALDTYGEYKQSYYDDMNALSDGKVMGISECGANVPTLDILQQQPKWSYYMVWADMLRPRRTRSRPTTRGPQMPDMPLLVNHPRMFSLEDAEYMQAITSVRAASGLPATRPLPLTPTTKPIAPAAAAR